MRAIDRRQEIGDRQIGARACRNAAPKKSNMKLSVPANGAVELSARSRPWLHLALIIHFFSLSLFLACNMGASELAARLMRVLSPYMVSVSQDFGGVPLGMTSGTEVDLPHVLEIRAAGSPQSEWQVVEPPRNLLGQWDNRWHNFVRMLAQASSEQNEDLVFMVFEHCVRAQETRGSGKIDAIRLVRRATLSYASDQAWVIGELPASQLEDSVLHECRVIHLSNGRLKLLPVLETTRTSKSLQTGRATAASKPVPDAAAETVP